MNREPESPNPAPRSSPLLLFLGILLFGGASLLALWLALTVLADSFAGEPMDGERWLLLAKSLAAFGVFSALAIVLGLEWRRSGSAYGHPLTLFISCICILHTAALFFGLGWQRYTSSARLGTWWWLPPALYALAGLLLGWLFLWVLAALLHRLRRG